MADGRYFERDAIDREAVRRMLRVHDGLSAAGARKEILAALLVRLAFYMFADDTGILGPRGVFADLVRNRTTEDGSDTAHHLRSVFEALRVPSAQELDVDEGGTQRPLIGRELLSEGPALPHFDARSRSYLIEALDLEWGAVSPAILGTLVQCIMSDEERRRLGAHFTSENNVHKVIGPLFLDALHARFETLRVRRDATCREELAGFQRELASLALLDPACGCGDFLLTAYRELRRLEMRVLKELVACSPDGGADVAKLPRLDLRQMYGIEIAQLSAEVAMVSLWMLDHVMNAELSRELGPAFARAALRSSPHVCHADALTVDWNAVLPANDATAVFGNPPFVGKKEQTARQKQDIRRVWGSSAGAGVLDYVTCWYRRAAEYVQGTNVPCAFVSTSSITQGEQVAALWPELSDRWNLNLHFAHRTFNWRSETRGRAHVHVAIIGFGAATPQRPLLYDYDDVDGEPTVAEVNRINPYLVDGPDVWLRKRSSPLPGGLPVTYGSFALDDGHFTLSDEERTTLLDECPGAAPFVRPFVGGKELIQGRRRWCLWLRDAAPDQLQSLPAVLRRVEAVQSWRQSSDRKRTRELADTPTVFAEIRQPRTRYLAFPTLSSVRRRYVPIAFLQPETIASNQVYVVANATLFHFGVLTSAVHMAWIAVVSGRFKSDYRYSAGIVYNHFPWPQTHDAARRSGVERAAADVLAARSRFEGASLADLYDPGAMPPVLVEAHARLDRAVDRCYRARRFESDRQRVEHLFALHAALTGGSQSASVDGAAPLQDEAVERP